jgi:hypothetical protein
MGAVKPSEKPKEATGGRQSEEDRSDYGNIGPEEFGRRIQADNDERYGNLIRNVRWIAVGEPGW